MRSKDPKALLMDWVDDQTQLDSRTKYILDKFARFANAKAQAFAPIKILAERTNSSERTVQYALRQLEADGLIRRTGKTEAWGEGTRFPREVPIYQIAAGVVGIDLDAAAVSGARIAPEPALGCKAEPSRVQTAAPLNEPRETNTPSDEGDARAQEREALFGRLEKAYPKLGLSFTNRAQARIEFGALLDQGIDVELLIQAAAGWAAHPKGKKTDLGLQYWLKDSRYRGTWPEPQLALEQSATASRPADQPGAAGAVDQTFWDELLKRMVYRMSEAEFGAYLSRAYLGEHAGELFLVAFSTDAKLRLIDRRRRQLADTWAEVDPQRRPMKIISKIEFAAMRARQTEGVG